MKKLLLTLVALLISATLSYAQGPVKLCFPTNSTGDNCVPVTSTNPLPTTPVASGTAQDVNLTKVQGAAPSLTNPLWVTPATGALFSLAAETTKVIGTVNQGTSPWVTSLSAETTKVIGTVNQGTSPWVTSLSAETTKVIGTVNQGTSPWVTSASLLATEVHAGEVGGNIIPITNALVTSNNTVTTGKAIGPLQTVAGATRVSGALGASGTSGIIQQVAVTFKDAVGAISLDVYYFNANPTAATCTDNTTFALTDADRDKIIGIVHITDITASNTVAISQANNLGIPFGIASGTSIFACVVTRASAAITGTANASLLTRVLRQ